MRIFTCFFLHIIPSFSHHHGHLSYQYLILLSRYHFHLFLFVCFQDFRCFGFCFFNLFSSLTLSLSLYHFNFHRGLLKFVTAMFRSSSFNDERTPFWKWQCFRQKCGFFAIYFLENFVVATKIIDKLLVFVISSGSKSLSPTSPSWKLISRNLFIMVSSTFHGQCV